MKQLIIPIFTLIFFSLIAKGQDKLCPDDKLKAVYFMCNSNPNDTAFKHLYFYNKNEQVERIEKYENNKFKSVIKNFYDSNNVLKLIYDLWPDSIQNLCGDNPIDLCYEKLKERIYNYDSLTGSCFFIFDESKPNKNDFDSIFIKGELFAVLENADTLYTLAYDSKGRPSERRNYCSNRVSGYVKIQYKDQKIIEYAYPTIDSKKPSMITEKEYDLENRIIKKTSTFIFNDMKKQPGNNYIIEKYRYEGNRLVEYQLIDNYIDPCFNYLCCGNYKKHYVYID